jgi:predicted enzyme related to lactoylglutathione lyase
MPNLTSNPVVHLELHTGNLPGACAFYTRMFGWRTETIHTEGGSYHALELGDRLDGGVAECGTRRPLWLPYVEVADVAAVTERAQALGAAVPLAPREGPAGWRSVIASPAGGEIAVWQSKALRREVG